MPLPSGIQHVKGIAPGRDAWLALTDQPELVKMTNGKIAGQIPMPAPVLDVVVGPAGAPWFVTDVNSSIKVATVRGEKALTWDLPFAPEPAAINHGVVIAGNGAHAWVAVGDRIARIDGNGKYSAFSAPTVNGPASASIPYSRMRPVRCAAALTSNLTTIAGAGGAFGSALTTLTTGGTLDNMFKNEWQALQAT